MTVTTIPFELNRKTGILNVFMKPTRAPRNLALTCSQELALM